jgi:hypothetical protein
MAITFNLRRYVLCTNFNLYIIICGKSVNILRLLNHVPVCESCIDLYYLLADPFTGILITCGDEEMYVLCFGSNLIIFSCVSHTCSGVQFHDGAPWDSAAAKSNFDNIFVEPLKSGYHGWYDLPKRLKSWQVRAAQSDPALSADKRSVPSIPRRLWIFILSRSCSTATTTQRSRT